MRTSLLYAALGLLGGCVLFLQSACTGSLDGQTPSLGPLEFIGQAPDSPMVLLLRTAFDDPDGDLGGGVLEVLVNDQDSGLGALDLEPLFFENNLNLDDTSGVIDFVVEVSLGSSIPEGGAVFKIGVRAVDAQLNVSNTQEVNLEISAQ